MLNYKWFLAAKVVRKGKAKIRRNNHQVIPTT